MFVRMMASEARRNDVVIIPRKFAADRRVRRMCARIRRVSDGIVRGRFDISLANVDGILSVPGSFCLMVQRSGLCAPAGPAASELIHTESLTISVIGNIIEGRAAPLDSMDSGPEIQDRHSGETESALAGTAASENPALSINC